MAQVFISYYREDKAIALNLKDRIEKEFQGITCWIDETKIGGGKQWREEIEKAIRDSSVLILVVTPKALERPWITYEWIFALGANKTVIPVIFERPEDYHPRLGDLQWRFFTDDRPQEWDKLFGDLRLILGQDTTIYAPVGSNSVIRNAVEDLNGSDRGSWFSAIEILEKMSGDEKASKVLYDTAINHPISDVRYKAAFAHLRQTKYSAIVIQTFRDAALQGNRDIRREAWSLLGNLGGNDTIDILRSAFQQEGDHLNRLDIINALGQTGHSGDPSAIPILASFLRTVRDMQERHAIIQAMTVSKSDDAVTELLEVYPGSLEGTQKLIIRALGTIGSPTAKEALQNLLAKEINQIVRSHIQDTLKTIQS
jgi:hypothetical protein